LDFQNFFQKVVLLPLSLDLAEALDAGLVTKPELNSFCPKKRNTHVKCNKEQISEERWEKDTFSTCLGTFVSFCIFNWCGRSFRLHLFGYFREHLFESGKYGAELPVRNHIWVLAASEVF
jgi:hypothetical protein